MTTPYKIIRFIVLVISRLIFRYTAIDFDKIPKNSKAVICCNHTSGWDAVMLAVCCNTRQVCFMGKKELFKNKILAYLFYKAGSFPVDRDGNDFGAIKKAQNILKNNGLICIFPEGTRSYDGQMHQGKAGAALIAVGTKSPIVPISIYRKGRAKIFSKTTLRCGNVIPYETLKEIKKSDAGLQGAIDYVMEQIKTLWEMKH